MATRKTLEEKLRTLEQQICNCCKVLPTTDGIPTEAPTNGQTVKIDLSTGIIYYFDSDTNTWESISGGGGFFTSSINPIATPVAQDANFSVYDIDNLDQLNINAEVGGQIILTTEGITGDSSVGIIDGSIVLGYTGDDLTYSSIIVSNDIVSLGTTNGQIYLSDGGVNYANPPQDDTKDSIVALDTVTGKVYLRDAATIGGGGAAYVEVTYAAAEALVAGSTLVPGTLYKITDRGDRGLFLVAISVNQFAIEGQRIMLVPDKYEDYIGTYVHLGMWLPTMPTPNIGDLVTFGGFLYRNLTGAIGSMTNPGDANSSLSLADWAVVSKSSFILDEYVEKVFHIHYDFANDWISKQWDDKGNIVGIEFLRGDNIGYNPIEYTDWNIGSRTLGTTEFSNNDCPGGISGTGVRGASTDLLEIVGNKCLGYGGIVQNFAYDELTISNNITREQEGISSNCTDGQAGVVLIYNNISRRITANNLTGSLEIADNYGGAVSNNEGQNLIARNFTGELGIDGNTSHTAIIDNYCISIRSNISNAGIISNNHGGAIIGNEVIIDISFNIVTENITGNICDNGSIIGNRAQRIYDNTFSNGFYNNTVLEHIANNSGNSGQIKFNTAYGIESNILSGQDITYNNIPGKIESNQCDVSNNTCTDAITDNTCSGGIYSNSNGGIISNNSHNGSIENNKNNGYISNCVGAGGFNVINNINNGNIDNPAGLAAADVTDAIVNK